MSKFYFTTIHKKCLEKPNFPYQAEGSLNKTLFVCFRTFIMNDLKKFRLLKIGSILKVNTK
jgi:hypothetical protein